jgi:AraC-like DNA-binding protein
VLPLSQPLMLHSSTPRRRGLNMGLVQGSSAGLLGGVLGPIVTVWLAESFGWRTAFYATVVPGLVMAGLVLWLVRDLRMRHPDTAAMNGETASEHTAGGWGAVLRHRNIVICLVIAVFYLTWFITTQTFTPLYLVEVKGFVPGDVGFVLTGIGIAWVLCVARSRDGPGCLVHTMRTGRGTSSGTAHLLSAKTYIAGHLGDPGLCVDIVARAVGVTPRHLNRAFAAEQTTVAQFILSRRLERAKADLAAPALAHFRVADIAFRWGFSSQAHFSRLFRSRFGCSPSEIRPG